MPTKVKPSYPYSVIVTETQTHYVNISDLRKEKRFREGQKDRREGKPCAFNDGIYLDGWYAPEKTCRFIPYSAEGAFQAYLKDLEG